MRPGMFKLSGKTTVQKFTHIENVLRSLMRRSKTAAIVVNPPVPISCVTSDPDVSGIVMRYMFPAEGMITKACVFVENFPLDAAGNKIREAKLFIKTSGRTKSVVHELLVKKIPTLLDLNYPVESGMRMEVSFTPGLLVNNIWVGMLYEITPGHETTTKILITELERIEQEALDEGV